MEVNVSFIFISILVFFQLVETWNQKNREGRTERAERVAENKRKTYVEAVKKHNNTALKEAVEDLIKQKQPVLF